MTRSRLLPALILALLTAGPAYSRELPDLPDSLAQWYKPANQRQVWLHTMFALRREMQAVEEYVAQGDGERAGKWLASFAKHYRATGEMVPEWNEELDLEALGRVEAAATALDETKLGDALRDLVRTCTSCHREYRALAAARHRGPDFSGVKVGEMGHSEAMEELSRTVNRIQIALSDERWEAAESALGGLRERLGGLGESCGGCHQDAPPRERILGQAMDQGLDSLAREIAARDPKAAGGRLGAVAVEVCARCHGVHRTLYDLERRIDR